MKNIYLAIILVSILFLVGALIWQIKESKVTTVISHSQELTVDQPVDQLGQTRNIAITKQVDLQGQQFLSKAEATSQEIFVWPIIRPLERITKKPFGIYVTPQNSPVQPERFSGFHTGTDFETFPDEANQDVLIMAICQGNVLFKGHVGGYGGVLVQSCKYNNESVTVLYGHLNSDSIISEKGDVIESGQKVGFLGRGNTLETDYERKHLHLSIHKGSAMDYRGYVSSQGALNSWLDLCRLFDCSQ